MLPLPPVIPPIRIRNRFRPISPLDNGGTTGLYNNPNGTVIPSTAQYGQQGEFGSGYPTVQGGMYDPLNPNKYNPYYHPNDMTGQLGISGSNSPYRGNNYAYNPFPRGVIGRGMSSYAGLGEEQAGGGAQKVRPSLVPVRVGGFNGIGTGMTPAAIANLPVQGIPVQFGQNTPIYWNPSQAGRQFPKPIPPTPDTMGVNVQSSSIRSARENMLVQNTPTSMNATNPFGVDNISTQGMILQNLTYRMMMGEDIDLTQDQYDALKKTITNGRSGSYDNQGYLQGERTQDLAGNPFNANNPNQATDIYGDPVVQAGESRWSRRGDGVLVRERAYGGRWHREGGARNAGRHETQRRNLSVGSYGVVQFNTGNG